MKLELSARECEAVATYIWQHSRGSPNGLAYKTWEKMWNFILKEQERKDLLEQKRQLRFNEEAPE